MLKKVILNISVIFDYINPKLINKILYTSSSSVYGSIGGKVGVLIKIIDIYILLLKISAENLVKNFCNKNKINFDICRILIFMDINDNFSIISKLIQLKNTNKKIEIYNNGDSIRDFIHVDDVVFIYKKLLNIKCSNIFDVGTGYGIKIKDIVNGLKLTNKNIKFIKRKKFEIDNSIANNYNLLKKIKSKKFKKLEKFLKIKKLNYQNNKIKPNYLENTLLVLSYMAQVIQEKNFKTILCV